MKKRILIVEDEENIREVCKRYLEREEYEVYTAVNGKEGWDLFLTCQPDLIILDLMMPKKRWMGIMRGNSSTIKRPYYYVNC